MFWFDLHPPRPHQIQRTFGTDESPKTTEETFAAIQRDVCGNAAGCRACVQIGSSLKSARC
mgnify:CR=1 FL=1